MRPRPPGFVERACEILDKVERAGGYELLLTDSTPATSMKRPLVPWHFRLSYKDRRNLSLKVLDFVKSGGPKLTVGRTIFEMWMGL